MATIKGFKFLTPWGTTESNGSFAYVLPRPDQKWGDWFEHPTPAQPDNQSCGAGRFHIMCRLDARYAPNTWWPWYAEIENLCGGDTEKISGTRIRLRRITPAMLARMLRLGCGKGANLAGASLTGANLTWANLTGANLTGANLTGANLTGANLTGASLTGANLTWASLTWANLEGANLEEANLEGANLKGANLTGAYLAGANLTGAYLVRANLEGANLEGAYLVRANLKGAIMPNGFNKEAHE